ncbi:MAG: alkaline phosphatase family protein [Sphingomonadales bacterium]
MPFWCRAVVAFLAALASAAAAAAPPRAQKPARPPKLIVVLSVDQLSAELFDRYRTRFRGGLRQLAGGIAFANGYQSHAATETCPGHSTILTGRHPATTGIAGNIWYDAASGSRVYCVAVPGATEPDARGPQNMKADTFGDWLKSLEPGARVVAVSGKDRAAITLGGHHADAVYWWNDGKGFGTSRYASPATPQVAAPAEAFNSALLAKWRKTPPRLWPEQVPPDCLPLEQPYKFATVSLSGKVPPDASLTVEARSDFPNLPEFQGQLRSSPAFDDVTLDFAEQLIDADRLGRGPATDLLAVSLSATDYVGHWFGNGGAEMCVQLHALDQRLGKFFARLASLHRPYAIVLTSDHGAIDAPERAAEHGLAARRIDGAGLVKALNDHLKQELGLGEDPIVGDDPQQLVIKSRDAALHARVSDAAVAWLKTRPEVVAAFTAAQVVAADPAPGTPPDRLTLPERFHESYVPGRSGDIMVAYLQYATLWMPHREVDLIAGHGSPWDYDRRVPILFWWPGVNGRAVPDPIETVDIAPTLSAIAGVPAPAVDGRCLAAVTSACPRQ